jgi:hypothetical protein
VPTRILSVAVATFAVLALAAGAHAQCLTPLVIGGELRASDCQLEMHVVNPNNDPFFDVFGRVNNRQTCRDGDPSCDTDGAADGTCTFQLASCFNCNDPLLPECVPIPAASYAITRPRLSDPDPINSANAEAMVAAVAALAGMRNPEWPYIVEFDPLFIDAACTALAPFKVPLRQTSRGLRTRRFTLRARSIAPTPTGLRWDADGLRLICVPAE